MIKKRINKRKLIRTRNKINRFIKKNRNTIIGVLGVLLLAGITLYASFAFFQNVATEPIVGGSVGDIADIKIIIMAQDRDSSGAPVANSYSQYAYVPKAGYTYNTTSSYCVNGSTLTYDSSDFSVNAETSRTDTCYAYFDAKDNLDIILNVYLEDADSNGNGLGTYTTKLETYDIPSGAYALNTVQSSCTNGATVTYDSASNKFFVESNSKTVCNAYMNVLNPDIAVTIYLQDRAGIDNYYKAKTIPYNIFYGLNVSKSSCTNGATLSIVKQEVKVSTSNRTKCVAYLDIATGPFIESVDVTGTTSQSATLSLAASNAGSAITTWYYSIDGGITYQSSNSNTPTVNGLIPLRTNEILLYGVDASGKQTREETVFVTTPGPSQGATSVSGVTYNSITLNTVGQYVTTWHYKVDSGSYQTTTSSTPTITGLDPETTYTIKVYGSDAYGNETDEVTLTATTNTYVFNGIYPYQATAYTKTIEVTGYYKLQVWGAQGGSYDTTYAGGKGGYSVGVVQLFKNDIIYIHTGGEGPSSGTSTTGYLAGGTNGGGASYSGSTTYLSSSGGGASDIRIKPSTAPAATNYDTYYARVITAGGGGGAGSYNASNLFGGGYGGGASGGDGSARNYFFVQYQKGLGGTATAAGTSNCGSSGVQSCGTEGAFGQGGSSSTTPGMSGGVAGGGGGWYGGGFALRASAGGGAGFVYTSSTASNVPSSGWLLTSTYYLTSASTTAGDSSFTSTSGGTETGHAGDGYALVTYCGSTASSCS